MSGGFQSRKRAWAESNDIEDLKTGGCEISGEAEVKRQMI